PEEVVRNLVARRGLASYTPNTITNVSRLERELALIRERGYSVDNEEIEEGLVCVGAPVRDYSGSVVASISIAGPAFRLTKAKIPAVAAKVTRGAGEFSTALGHRDMERLVSVRRRSRPAAG
ncbi:MAG: IclR family transcriptional regulator, partial [bacterium]